jgi:beta-phosphoglucomutase
LIKACIFDLDGVIVDTAHYHFMAWKRLGAELGVNLTEQENEKLKGVSRMDSLEIILKLGGVVKNKQEKEALAAKKNNWFIEYINEMKANEIFPGVKELIHQIRASGRKVALASSSKNAETVIGLLGIGPLFDVMIDGTMIIHTKPDPEIFLLAASRLAIDPKDCLVFEDAEAGVEAAVRAGMKCIGVGSPAQLSKANIIVKNTADFEIKNLDTL